MDEGTFLSALQGSPDDEVTWLALADWLEEDGQAQRAELVRLTRRLRTLPAMKRRRQRPALEDRLAALLQEGVQPVAAEVGNSLGMRLALIPPGSFRMGSPRSEKGRRGDEQAHEVEITRPFYLGVFPVTQAQWRAVLGGNPSWFSAGAGGEGQVKGLNTDDFPVETVSWEDVAVFLGRLSALPQERKRGWKYRLPSEAEWEYSSRGGACSSTPFHTGNSLSSSQANFHGDHPYGSAARGPYLGRPSSVGSYRPNAFGLYDCHGNVWEWCADWFDGGYYRHSPRQAPPGPPEGSNRVIRGGCWLNSGQLCRSAQRSEYPPSSGVRSLGFRLALVLPGR